MTLSSHCNSTCVQSPRHSPRHYKTTQRTDVSSLHDALPGIINNSENQQFWFIAFDCLNLLPPHENVCPYFSPNLFWDTFKCQSPEQEEISSFCVSEGDTGITFISGLTPRCVWCDPVPTFWRTIWGHVREMFKVCKMPTQRLNFPKCILRKEPDTYTLFANIEL